MQRVAVEDELVNNELQYKPHRCPPDREMVAEYFVRFYLVVSMTDK
jgi:hypothetical protein